MMGTMGGDMMAGMMMFYSLAVARVLGPLFLLVGLGALINMGYMREMIDEFAKGKQHVLMMFAGVVQFLFGMFLVSTHNMWVANWTVIITIIGWVSLIKGVVALLLPRVAISMINFFRGQSWWIPVAGIIALVIGAVFSYFGYAAPMPNPMMY